jgi:hypothetical protein
MRAELRVAERDRRHRPVIKQGRVQQAAWQAIRRLDHIAPGDGEIVEFCGIARTREPAGYADDRNRSDPIAPIAPINPIILIPPSVHCAPAPGMISSVTQS